MGERQNPWKWKAIDLRAKTAAIATGMNILLTGIKFLLYFFSGSMAILAEAWHSFSDITTSLLVFLAVRRSDDGLPDKGNMGGDTDAGSGSRPLSSRAELLASLGIGVLLMCVAIGLLKKAIQAETRPIDNALVSGLLFLAFSVGSYFMYRFEMRIGKKTQSLGLVSDGMHARADMTASMLTGFSLIVYSMGLDLDRWVAGLIALFILSFALETLVNVAQIYFRRGSEYLLPYRFHMVLASLFNGGAIQRTKGTIKTLLENRFGHTRAVKTAFRFILYSPFIVILLIYVSTAFFTVAVREQAVVERFGKPLNFDDPLGPGFHCKMPWPIDRVQKVNTFQVADLNIGNITDRQNRALIWTRKHGTEEPFLSGDNNLFYPYIVLHYRVKNIFDYLYRHMDARAVVKEVAHRVSTDLFAKQAFYTIAASHRKRFETEMHQQLQGGLNALESGIEILAVNLKDIHPPIAIADSFENVIAGYQEKQRIINEALGYKNKALPEAQGKATRELEAAKGHIIKRVKRAEGDATRFRLSLPVSKGERDITLSRIYLDTMTEILKDKKKIVVEPGIGEPEIWMDFESLFPGGSRGGRNR